MRQAHQFESDFLAQLAGAKKQNTSRMLTKRSAKARFSSVMPSIVPSA